MPLKNNPLRHYNKSQVRLLQRRIHWLRVFLATGHTNKFFRPAKNVGFQCREGKYPVCGGLCGALNMGYSTSSLSALDRLPIPHWNNVPGYSGHPRYPVASAAYPDPKQAFMHIGDALRWAPNNEYGSNRLAMLCYLENAAIEMQQFHRQPRKRRH